MKECRITKKKKKKKILAYRESCHRCVQILMNGPARISIFRISSSHNMAELSILLSTQSVGAIGLYRDVWIAAIASSRTRLATLSGVMCNTSQCELRSLRVNSGMLNVIRIVTYYTLPALESPTSSWIAMAYSR